MCATTNDSAVTSDAPSLAGRTVGVTAERRAGELITMLERRGAVVLHGPALRIVPLDDDTQLATATERLIAAPADVTVATTGVGFRGWLEAADGWDSGERLRAALGAGRLIARGPKARGAIRAAGLVDEWSPPSESFAEVLSYLLDGGVAGLRLAVQLHGDPLTAEIAALRAAGAEVVEVPVYRWVPPADLGPLDGLTDALLAGGVDAMTFTSAPAAASLLSRAADRGIQDAVIDALRRSSLVMCVGPVAAGPMERAGVPAVWPARYRLGALVRALESELTAPRPGG